MKPNPASPGDVEAESHQQVPLGEDDAKQASLARQAKRGKGRLPKPERQDLRRHHPLSMGRNSAEFYFRFPDGRQVNMKNISEEAAREAHRNCLRAAGAPGEALPEPTQAKPGEVQHTMPLSALQDALVAVGPEEALIPELIEKATQGVITREHELYEKFETRFNNSIRRCAKALREQGLLVWSRWVTVNKVGMRRYGCGPTLPRGAELRE